MLNVIEMSKNKQKMIVFFDEFNTNKNISGLFKEIIIDRKLKGVPINQEIVLIAACNPY